MKIRELKGIGEKTEGLMAGLGIFDTSHLLKFYPRTYDIFDNTIRINDIDNEGVYAIYGLVRDVEMKNNSRYKIITANVFDEDGSGIRITWFNMPFLKNQLRRGTRYIFRGKVAFKGSLVFMEQPKIYTVSEYEKVRGTLQPVYHLTAGLSNTVVTKAVKECFKVCGIEKEYLPQEIILENGLADYESAQKNIHFPKDAQALVNARKRLVFDEFFLFTTSVRSLRKSQKNTNSYIIGESDITKKVINNLGYILTDAQEKVYKEIVADMQGRHSMNRLIQGDVGSGKTILAFLAMLNTAQSGCQSALMAPTEVLAKQHYEALTQLIDKNKLDFKCALLTGSVKQSEKNKIKEALSDGHIDFVIGTHAIITENTVFNNLALVITDEQHRFGVRQRENLTKKGKSPHIIVMSATPIPRSLAIILYGDLDISILNEKPSNRLPVKNCIVDDSYRNKSIKFILDEVKKGHQAYIICAMAEENDENELENVVDFTDKLKQQIPKEYRVQYLHGKMKASLKNDIMKEFAEGKIDILVSTTVVEVGINVPNATVMMIINAERFGLAGLHQLRGRVGRGKDQSYCIFESNTKNELTKERLKILKDSNDGFYISEQDLKLRGPGDMLGIRQSGDMGFVLGNIYSDASVLKQASEAAKKLMEEDWETVLSDNPALEDKLRDYMDKRLNTINI